MFKYKKIIFIFLLSCLVITGIVFISPRPAKAQWTVSAPALEAIKIQEQVKKTIGAGIVQAGTIALINALDYFVQKLAYDVGTWIGSGGPGEKPLFDTKSTGEYFKDLALDTAAGAIQEVTTEITRSLGKAMGSQYLKSFNVCAPVMPQVLLRMQLGIFDQVKPPELKCSWNQFYTNWDNIYQQFDSSEVLKNFGVVFEGGQSELSAALEINAKTAARLEIARRQAELDRVYGGKWKDNTNFLTGRVTAPSDVVKMSFGESWIKGDTAKQTASFNATMSALGSGAWQVVGSGIQTLTQAALKAAMSKVIGKVFSLFDLYEPPKDGGPALVDVPGDAARGRRQVENVLNDLLRPTIRSSTNYDPVLEFTACPAAEAEKQINNCAMDDGFANAVRVAGGKPLTLDEAIKQGYLHGDWPLISSRDPRNEQKDCYTRGYCYSNLVKLRKARILPVGFELAAELAGSGAVAMAGSGALNVNLKTVMDNFYTCGENADKSPIRDSGHPFCHLIDPNWVLKVPKTQCQAQVYGPTLISTEGSIRAEVCADPITCISEDDSGNCTGGWGYCTKEKNIWRIDGDKCPEQFNSCATYKTRAGGVENYLKNTVDFGLCSEANTGCRPYAKEQANGVWSLASDKRAYFNKNLEVCAAKDAGCSEVYDTSEGLKYNLLPNPSFENFKDFKIFGWTNPLGTIIVLSSDGSNAFDGKTAAKVVATEMETEQAVKLELNTPYTFSVYAKGGVGGQYTAVLSARFFADFAAKQPFSAANIITTCKNTEGNVLGVSEVAPKDSFTRLSCSFLSPNQMLYAKIALSTVLNDVVWYDAAQLEAGAEATPFLASGYGTVNSKFIKIPPTYRNCGVGSTDPACVNYAAICRADEAGCAKYSPTSGDPAIAGIVAANDTCFESCAGYETYKQEATVYDPQPSPQFSYFIPQTAQVCNAMDVGCDEFTNLENEARDYFTLLRQCIKPNSNLEATYYTWEGSDQAGYELKSHKLKKDSVSGGPEYVAGANAALCDQTIFKAKLGDPNYNPDCREFYDSQGKIYYRLLSKTIISTPECAAYRKTDSNQANCGATGGQWDSAKSICVYQGYKSGSLSCNAGANGCRAWSGASASNLRLVFQDDFESGGAQKWQSGTVSSESLSAGGHSLKFSGATLERELSTSSVFANKTYIFSFWAKAPSGGKLTVNFIDAAAQTARAGVNIVDLKGEWRYFEVGPFHLTSVAANPRLQLALSGGAGFYLDNAVLKEVSQRLFLVKNSWKTPLKCDQTNAGVFLPQAQLGCKAYKDKDGKNAYLKSFSSLCRDAAAGCALFRNTQNSASDKSEIYNAICVLNHFVQSDSEECQAAGKTVCNVGRGSVFCRFKIDDAADLAPIFVPQSGKKLSAYQTDLMNKVGSAASAIMSDESTVIVPADANIYLVDDGKHSCQNKDLGCREIGQMSLYSSSVIPAPPSVIPAEAGIQTVYFKDRPNDYSSILCGAESEGCESWTSDKGTDFFKVPANLCEYKEGGAITTAGWYKKGTSEACYATKDIKGNITSVYIKNGGFGIWRNADPAYDGSAGICGVVYNSCTEFIDPQDTSVINKKGKPYYLLDNDKLNAVANDPACSAKASLEEGCVLFDKTSDIVKKWNAGATYWQATKSKQLESPAISYGNCTYMKGNSGSTNIDAYCKDINDCSPAGPGETVQCKTASPSVYNSNIILKVTRDRECGEWLTCKTSFSAADPITQKTKSVCTEVGLCNKYQSAAGQSSSCANFITQNPDSGRLLSADYYAGRKVGWAGMDYSGFSFGNKFSVADVKALDADSSPDAKDFRLYAVAKIPLSGGGAIMSNQTIDGAAFDKNLAEGITCRGYPEQDAPFPLSAGQYDTQGFKNANTCENGRDACECDYTKLVYGSTAVKKYTDYGNRSVPKGICQGGQNDGGSCDPAATFENDPKNSCGDPGQGGTCLKLKRYDDVVGWSGYCLERDLSTPINGDKNQKACLTWWPQDLVQGGRDIYNQFRAAGYTPPIGGGKYYCLQAAGNYVSNNDVVVNPKNRYIKFLTTYRNIANANNKTNFIMGTGESPGSVVPYYYGSLRYSLTQIGATPGGEWKLREFFTEGSDNVEIMGVDNTIPGKEGDPNKRGVVGDPIYKDALDGIEIKVTSSNYPESYAQGASFYIENGRKNKEYIAGAKPCDSAKTSDNCSGEPGGFLLRKGRARAIAENEYWYLRFDDSEDPGKDFRTVDFFADKKQADWYEACRKEDKSGWLGGTQSVLQLRFHFNPTTGKLDEVAAASCETSGGGDVVWDVKIFAHTRETCWEIVDVAASKNAAMTQNVWPFNSKNKDKDAQVSGGLYHYDYEIQPFGSAYSDIAPSNDGWYSYNTVGTLKFAGVPWSCSKDCGTPGAKIGGKYGSDGNLATIDFDPEAQSNILHNIADGINYLKNIFAKAFKIYTGGVAGYNEAACSKDASGKYVPEGCFDYTQNPSVYKKPQIYSYNPQKILSNKQFALGQPNGLVVNGTVNQSVQIKGSQYPAVVRFYAWADDNQMPLKSIMVDWGDGSSVTETADGLYKNHKPLCAKNNDKGIAVCSEAPDIACASNDDCVPKTVVKTVPGKLACNLIKYPYCQETYCQPGHPNFNQCEAGPPTTQSVPNTCVSAGNPTFGSSPDACEEGYFEFWHIYICENAAGQSCLPFAPKVTVTDNWGITSNTATGGTITLTP